MKLFNRLAHLRKKKPEDCIIICSEPRAGSTWLMELMLRIRGTRVVWEPFHVEKGVLPREFNLGWRPCVPENDSFELLKEQMDSLLSGYTNNLWTKNRSPLWHAVTQDQIILKTVRANMLLPWLTRQYTFRHTPVLLVRHPVATCLSQISTFDYHGNPGMYNPPACFNNTRFLQNAAYINSLPSALERQVALWCIQHKDLLNTVTSEKRWSIVYYENLLLQPQSELNRISLETGIVFPVRRIEQSIRQVSQSDFKKTYAGDQNVQVIKWKERVPEELTERIQSVLDKFEIRVYTANDVLPIKTGV